VKRLLLSLIALLPISVLACIWDRDTLAYEAKEFPGALRVIVGRFERNPPLYYEMRLKRVTDQLRKEPDRLDLYDDAGAAADRLGRSQEAIHFMIRKRQQIELLQEGDVKREHLYRYHANIGTFMAHQWLKDPERDGDLELLREAYENISEAIRINPEAHFGREIIQLMVMEWALVNRGDMSLLDPDGPGPRAGSTSLVE
jgi:tetratricopeptide (TPR) repeat protein